MIYLKETMTKIYPQKLSSLVALDESGSMRIESYQRMLSEIMSSFLRVQSSFLTQFHRVLCFSMGTNYNHYYEFPLKQNKVNKRGEKRPYTIYQIQFSIYQILFSNSTTEIFRLNYNMTLLNCYLSTKQVVFLSKICKKTKTKKKPIGFELINSSRCLFSYVYVQIL